MSAAIKSAHCGLRWFRRGRGRNVVYGVDDGDKDSNDIRTIAFVEATNRGAGAGASGRRCRWRAVLTARTGGERMQLGFNDRDEAFGWIAEWLEARGWKQP